MPRLLRGHTLKLSILPLLGLMSLTVLAITLSRSQVPVFRSGGQSDSIMVFAAASLTDAVEALAQRYEHATGVEVNINCASSSTLARQIAAGAKADIYISANVRWMDYLKYRNLVRANTGMDLLTNRLVIVAGKHSPQVSGCEGQTNFLANFTGRLAVGDPSHVPVGVYARQALIHMGLWNTLKEQLATASNVRAALRLVETGEADAGIVYSSDAYSSSRVRVLWTVPQAMHEPIRYPAALCAGSNREAAHFLKYLSSERAQATLVSCGFTPIGDALLALPPAGEPFERTSTELNAAMLSLKVGVIALLIILGPAVACGWLLARTEFFGKSVLETLVYAPLVMPPVATGYVVLRVLGRNGLVGRWLHDWFDVTLAFSWHGAVIVAAIVGLPLLVRSVRTAFSQVDPQLEQAAATEGASRGTIFRTITLPMALPGVMAGMTLAFARGIGEFGATVTFAGNIQGQTSTLPLALYRTLQTTGGESAALRMTGMSLMIAFTAIAVSEMIERKARRWTGL